MNENTIRAANEMLQTLRMIEANAAKIVRVDDFMTLVSHEFSNPISSLLNHLHLLGLGEYGPLTDKQTHIVEQLYSDVKLLANLVLVASDMARTDRAKKRFNPVELAIAALVEELEAETRLLCANSAVEFECSVAPGAAFIWTDPIRLRLALRNLLLQAVKLTAGGKVTLEIDSEKSGLLFLVRSSGVEILAGELPKILDSAPPMPAETWDVTGLSWVEQLVDLIGGRINAESQTGKGITFRVWIPNRKP